jgi:hypothetical protein
MSFVPQTQIWPDQQYIPGSLQCDVLTRYGLNCGNLIGQGRCLEYCSRLARHWDGKLLPLAIKLAVASENSPEVYNGWRWVPIDRPILYFWQLPATTVQVQVVYLRENQPIYRNNMTIVPTVNDSNCYLHVEIPLPQDPSFTSRLRHWLNAFCRHTPLFFANGIVEFDIILPSNSTVGVVVNVALQIMLLESLRYQPFSLALRYILPEVIIDGYKGIRVKNTQALTPEYDLSAFY